jgi:hypothetical protein
MVNISIPKELAAHAKARAEEIIRHEHPNVAGIGLVEATEACKKAFIAGWLDWAIVQSALLRSEPAGRQDGGPQQPR